VGCTQFFYSEANGFCNAVLKRPLPSKPRSPGQWTNSLGTVWTINPNGSSSVVGTKPKRQIWGNITVAGDTITIQETRGQSPKNCKLAATYKFSRPNPNTLAFHVSEGHLQRTD